MTNVSEVLRIMDEQVYTDQAGNTMRLLDPEDVCIDDIGVGRGVTDRIREISYAVNGVTVGEKARDATTYKNIECETFWNARTWLQAGGKLVRHDKFNQLTWIQYKVNTGKVLQIEPKEDLKQRTGNSPDYAEAFMLTFVQKAVPNVRIL